MKHAPRQSAAAEVAAGAAGTAGDAAVVAAVGVAATEAVAGAAAIAATVEIAGNNKKRSESESLAPQLRSGRLNPSEERESSVVFLRQSFPLRLSPPPVQLVYPG